MAASNKETIYVDVDDEITNIIDKVKTSNHKIIALVLPKRATVLQSVVNMKLLKKAADTKKKNLVLITSETGLMPLAAVAGLHVAKSLQSKPAIPPLPNESASGLEPEIIGDDDKPIDTAASIGALAAAANSDDETETIELDNMKMDTPAESTPAAKFKKLKHLKVPNFERFRSRFFLAGLGLILLIIGWYFAFIVLPEAHITIKTDTTTVVSSFDFTASEDIDELDAKDKKIPATLKEISKTESEKVPATGERDDGTKASGEVELSASCTSSSVTVSEGSTVTSSGLNFITQETVELDDISGGGPGNWVCSETVGVVSAENGDKYNIGSDNSFTVSGNPGVSGTNPSGFGGGTSKIVKVVSQKDVDDAMAKINARINNELNDEFTVLFEGENLFALTETKKTGKQKITPNPKVNKEGDEVTVNVTATYTMLGVKRDDMNKMVENDVEGDIDTSKQAITDYGIDSAIMRLNNQPSAGEASISFRTSVVAGPEIDEVAVKEAIRGKKRGEAEQYIGALPGVEEVVVEYSPFWVYSTPKAAKKINITIEKPAEVEQTTTDESQ